MIEALKKQFQILFADWYWNPVIIWGSGILGQVLFYIIMRTEMDETTCFAMGTMFAAIFFVIFTTITAGMSVGIYFNVEISLGNTRKKFFWTYYIYYVVYFLIGAVEILVLNIMENHVLTILYPGLENEINFVPYLIKFGVPAAIVFPILSMLFGLAIVKFGTKAFCVLWVIWMFGCLGVPRIIEAVDYTPNSMFGRIGTWAGKVIMSVPVGVWIGLGAVGFVACLAGSWAIARKQQVTM